MIKNQKGISLAEILIAMAIMVLFIPLIYSLFLYSVETFNTSSKYVFQQDKVVEVVNRIRTDVAEAREITISDSGKTLELQLNASGETRIWSFDDNALKIDDQVLVSEIKADESSFSVSEGRFILEIQPIQTNTGKHQSRNIIKPIITEFSVKYK